MSVTGGTIFSTGGTIAPPVNMLDEVLALNNIQHTSGSVNFPFHVEEPYNTTGVRKKKTRIPIFRTLEVRMPKFAHDRWFAYARRHEYQIGVRIQKTCVRKDKNTAPGQNYGRIYLVLFTKPVLLTFTSNRLQGT